MNVTKKEITAIKRENIIISHKNDRLNARLYGNE